MTGLTLETLGLKVAEQRGRRGVREAAKEIGISAATVSRVERGKLPDLHNFGKICRWLGVDPGEVLGFNETAKRPAGPVLHFGFWFSFSTRMRSEFVSLEEYLGGVYEWW